MRYRFRSVQTHLQNYFVVSISLSLVASLVGYQSIVCSLDPYVEQFWRLEQQKQRLFKIKAEPENEVNFQFLHWGHNFHKPLFVNFTNLKPVNKYHDYLQAVIMTSSRLVDTGDDPPPTDGYLEVCALLDPRSTLTLESRCAFLEILSEKYPVRVLNAILKYLDQKSVSGKKNSSSHCVCVEILKMCK